MLDVNNQSEAARKPPCLDGPEWVESDDPRFEEAAADRNFNRCWAPARNLGQDLPLVNSHDSGR
jgi:hypothetical protein